MADENPSEKSPCGLRNSRQLSLTEHVHVTRLSVPRAIRDEFMEKLRPCRRCPRLQCQLGIVLEQLAERFEERAGSICVGSSLIAKR